MKYLVIILSLLFSINASAQVFMTLKECKSKAIENNKDLKISKNNLETSKRNIKIAKSNFLPNVKIKGQGVLLQEVQMMRSQNAVLPQADLSSGRPEMKMDPSTGQPVLSNVLMPGGDKPFGKDKSYEVSLAIEQPVYMGGKIRSGYAISKLAGQISESQSKLTNTEVLLKTEQAYWQLVSLKEKVLVAQEFKKLLEDLVRNLKNNYELGLIKKTEVLKAQVQLNNAELNLLKANNGFMLSRMALCEIIGIDLNTQLEIKDVNIKTETNVVRENYFQTALKNREEIKVLENNVKIKGQQVKIARAEFLPQIGVGFNLINKNPNRYFEAEPYNTWNAGINLTLNVFHWGEKKQKFKISKLDKEISEFELNKNKDLIKLEVQQAYFKLQESVKKIQMTNIALERAKENLQETKNTFEVGISLTTDLLDAHAQWQQAKNDFIDSKIEFKVNELLFKKTLGELN